MTPLSLFINLVHTVYSLVFREDYHVFGYNDVAEVSLLRCTRCGKRIRKGSQFASYSVYGDFWRTKRPKTPGPDFHPTCHAEHYEERVIKLCIPAVIIALVTLLIVNHF